MLLDDSLDRRIQTANADFDRALEAFRAGSIFARDAKQYTRWRTAADKRAGVKPTKNLAQLAHDFGGNVSAGDFEFRH